MAIRKSLVKKVDGFDGSLVAQNAYWKVVNVIGSKEQISFDVVVSLDEKQIHNCSYSFAPDMEGPNFIKQAYEHLKTLPEFADAVDC